MANHYYTENPELAHDLEGFSITWSDLSVYDR